MKKIFVTYGSNAFVESANRIAEEAKSLNIFDTCNIFGEKDLPLPIKSSPLFLTKKGGGYWLWKPYVIYNTLLKSNDGDYIVYVDCGSEIMKTLKWEDYFNLLEKHDNIFFQYRDDFTYGWSSVNKNYSDSPKLKHWIKKSTINHFTKIFESDNDWLEKNKLWAGFIILKNNKQTRKLIEEWLNVMLFFPEIVNDVMLHEINDQTEFYSENRYDQTILTVVARYFEKHHNTLILNEESESYFENQAVKASRKIDKQKGGFKNKLRAFFNKIKKIK